MKTNNRHYVSNAVIISILVLALSGCSSIFGKTEEPSPIGSPPPQPPVAAPSPERPPAPPPVAAPTPARAPAPAPIVRAPPPAPSPEPGVGQKDGYVVVPVFFATDRNLTGQTRPSKMFGTERDEISYGVCNVSIPNTHRTGEVEQPSIWRLEFREKPSKHVMLLSAGVQSKATFFAKLSARVRSSNRKSAFIFVHGYNVSFVDAARRTAQMAYDLGFDGASVFYSWPSKASTADYPADEATVELTEINLKVFLEDFLAHSRAEDIYLIAHSMGNRALTGALSALVKEKPAHRKRFKEIILTAPDIDADVFKKKLVPALASANAPITLYASTTDKALLASKKFHKAARAGDSGAGLIIAEGVETIDATNVNTSFLGHSYFADNRSALSDIFYLLNYGYRPDERFGLLPVSNRRGRYWVFKQ